MQTPYENPEIKSTILEHEEIDNAPMSTEEISAYSQKALSSTLFKVKNLVELRLKVEGVLFHTMNLEEIRNLSMRYSKFQYVIDQSILKIFSILNHSPFDLQKEIKEMIRYYYFMDIVAGDTKNVMQIQLKKSVNYNGVEHQISTSEEWLKLSLEIFETGSLKFEYDDLKMNIRFKHFEQDFIQFYGQIIDKILSTKLLD